MRLGHHPRAVALETRSLVRQRAASVSHDFRSLSEFLRVEQLLFFAVGPAHDVRVSLRYVVRLQRKTNIVDQLRLRVGMRDRWPVTQRACSECSNLVRLKARSPEHRRRAVFRQEGERLRSPRRGVDQSPVANETRNAFRRRNICVEVTPPVRRRRLSEVGQQSVQESHRATALFRTSHLTR